MKTETLNKIAAFVLILVVVVIVLNIKLKPSTGDTSDEKLIPILTKIVNQVSKIEFIRGEDLAVYELQENKWVDSTRFNYPLNFENIKSHLLALSSIKGAKAMTNNKNRHEKLNLNWPDESGIARLVRIYTNKEESPVLQIVLGAEKWQPRATYLRLLESDQTWRCSQEIPFELNGTRWMDRKICAVPESDILSVDINGILITKEENSGSWSIKYNDSEPISEEKEESYKSTVPSFLSRLDFEDVRARKTNLSLVPDFVISYYLKKDVIKLKMYKIEEDYWSTLDFVENESDIESPESDKQFDSFKQNKWLDWEYKLPSWRANQIFSLINDISEDENQIEISTDQ